MVKNLNFKIELNLSASEELSNAILTIAAILHSVFINNSGSDKTIKGTDGIVKEGTNIKNGAANGEKSDGVQAVTIEILREKLNLLSKAGKIDLIRALLKKYGSKNITDVATENYRALFRDIEDFLGNTQPAKL
jgi:Flp pilus assembly CpaE family ATPase